MAQFTPHGKHLIGGEWVAGETSFASSPAHGPAHDYSVGTPDLVARATDAFTHSLAWAGLAGGPFAARLRREVPHGA